MDTLRCDSCNQLQELFEVPHHQVGNPHVWHYCARCKQAHEDELKRLEQEGFSVQTEVVVDATPTEPETVTVETPVSDDEQVLEVKETEEEVAKATTTVE